MNKVESSRKTNLKKVRLTLGLLLLALTFAPAPKVHAELVEEDVETEGQPNVEDNNDNNNDNGNEQDGNAVVDNGNGGSEETTTPEPIPTPGINSPLHPEYDASGFDGKIKPVVDEYAIKRNIPKTGARQLFPFALIGSGAGIMGFGIYKVIESKIVYAKKKNKTRSLTKKNPDNK